MGRAFAWLTFASTLRSLLGIDCDIVIDRPGIPGLESRAVPVPDELGLSIVWQTDHEILMQRYDRDCGSGKLPFVVNSTDMWHRPSLDGLGDAVSLGVGITVISWTRGGHVWFVVVNGENRGVPTLASNSSSEFSKAEVRAHPLPGGFALIWSCWQEDGDGWGVFMRRFTDAAQPIGDVMQVNVKWRDFQWRPQVASCAGDLWALWLNTSATCDTYRGCATGPLLRRFSLDRGDWDDEVTMNETQPLGATLSCHPDGMYVLWNTWSRYHWRLLSSLSSSAGADMRENPASAAVLNQALSGITSRRLTTLGDELHTGETTLVAHPEYVAMMYNDPYGKLSVQLLQYSLKSPIPMTPALIRSGTQLSRAVWDSTTNPPTLVLCAVAGGVLSSDGKPAYYCWRRGVSALHGSVINDIFSTLALAALFFLVCFFYCVKHGARIDNGVFQRRRPRSRRRLRLNQLRQQLSAMPSPVTPSSPSEISLQGTGQRPTLSLSGNEISNVVRTGAQERPTQPPAEMDWCPICRQEILIRVVLERCGHTACRDCALRLLDSDKKCYVCGEVVKGMLPVYL